MSNVCVTCLEAIVSIIKADLVNRPDLDEVVRAFEIDLEIARRQRQSHIEYKTVGINKD